MIPKSPKDKKESAPIKIDKQRLFLKQIGEQIGGV